LAHAGLEGKEDDLMEALAGGRLEKEPLFPLVQKPLHLAVRNVEELDLADGVNREHVVGADAGVVRCFEEGKLTVYGGRRYVLLQAELPVVKNVLDRHLGGGFGTEVVDEDPQLHL